MLIPRGYIHPGASRFRCDFFRRDLALGIREVEYVPAEATLPTDYGEFKIRIFSDTKGGLDHVALTMGRLVGPNPTPVRIHSECLTGDALGSLRCDCGPQLRAALSEIDRIGYGCLVYLRQEERDRAESQDTSLQPPGFWSRHSGCKPDVGAPRDARDYSLAAKILESLGVGRISLMTNNPDKLKQLTDHGIDVVERLPLIVGVGKENVGYLETKAQKMGHVIPKEDLGE